MIWIVWQSVRPTRKPWPSSHKHTSPLPTKHSPISTSSIINNLKVTWWIQMSLTISWIKAWCRLFPKRMMARVSQDLWCARLVADMLTVKSIRTIRARLQAIWLMRCKKPLTELFNPAMIGHFMISLSKAPEIIRIIREKIRFQDCSANSSRRCDF